jgi:hypothetical protein
MAISLVFDGHVRNVDNLRLDVFVTFTIAAATELPADTFLTLVLDRWGRRWLACGSMVISGVFSVWASLVSNREWAHFFSVPAQSRMSAPLSIIARHTSTAGPSIHIHALAPFSPSIRFNSSLREQ